MECAVAEAGQRTRVCKRALPATPRRSPPASTSSAAPGRAQGFALVFVVRRFAQPLGIDLPKWEKRTVETKKGVVRLLPVAERARYLFGERGAQAVAARLEREAAAGTDPLQGLLFPDRQETAAVALRERRPRYGDGGDRDPTDDLSPAPGATTLDRVHAGLLFQAGGQTNALHVLLKTERERGCAVGATTSSPPASSNRIRAIRHCLNSPRRNFVPPGRA